MKDGREANLAKAGIQMGFRCAGLVTLGPRFREDERKLHCRVMGRI